MQPPAVPSPVSSDLKGVEVAIIGLGASGEAAAHLVLAQGGLVYVSDLRTDAPTTARAADLRARGADVELGGHDVERMARARLVVVSPGIPPDAPVLQSLRGRDIRPISEPELAVRFYRGPLVGITGTNGKTTTTLLVGHLLGASGMSAAVGGNVGGGFAPAASELALLPEAPDWYVLEMSSFQLAGIERFRPDIGVVTNLSPDHLDRYASVEAYYADKARLFLNASAESRWVIPADDRAVEQLLGDTPGKRYRFAAEAGAGVDAWIGSNRKLTVAVDGAAESLLGVDELPLLGAHNRMNALAAALVAILAGADPSAVAEGLRTAVPLPHRMEPVLDREGVLWVNDSKATNVAATRSALRSLERPVVLLLGGKDKGEDFGPLASASSNLRVVLTYGAAGPRAADELEHSVNVERMGWALEDVVRRAAEVARPGDVVLLSPACSSFDMFADYEERGRRFTELAGMRA